MISSGIKQFLKKIQNHGFLDNKYDISELNNSQKDSKSWLFGTL